MESNVQILSGLQSQLQATQLELDRARQQKLYLDSLRQQYQLAESEDLNRQLANLRSRYTDNYPDIIALKEKIAKRDQLLNQIAAQAGEARCGEAFGTDAANSGPDRSPLQLEIEVPTLRGKAARTADRSVSIQVESHTRNRAAACGHIAGLRRIKGRVRLASQEAKPKSELAANLEKGQEGKYFKILDPPNLPSRPFAPNHFLIALKGLAAGIALGFILAALAERRI